MDIRELRVPVWCPLCSGMMKGRSTGTWYTWKVCSMCFVYFIEHREERWKSGWRPSEDELQAMSDDLREET